jgi:superfamily II DNA or RNA helicase
MIFPEPQKCLTHWWFQNINSRMKEKSMTRIQFFIWLYMSPLSPYRSILVIQPTGTGKTFSAAGVSHEHICAGNKVIFLSYSNSSYIAFTQAYENFVRINKIESRLKLIEHYGFTAFMNKNQTEHDDEHDDVLFVIDEAHNLRRESVCYEYYQKFFSQKSSARVLLLTATPMINSDNEINDLRMLVSLNINETSIPTPIIISDESLYNNIVNYIGRKVDGVDMPLMISTMGRRQRLAYEKSPDDSLYISKIQASIAVDIFKGYGPKAETFELNDSCKIKKAISYLKEGEKTVIFCGYVKGSGVYAITQLLKEKGFVEYAMLERSSFETSVSKGRKYAICTGTTGKKERILEEFNTCKDGKSIEILVCSEVFSESVDLMNVRHLHIINPHWNLSLINQMIGRTTRNILNHKVNVYLHVAAPNRNAKTENIDIMLYQISCSKQKNINNALKNLKKESIELGSEDISLNVNIGDVPHSIRYNGVLWDYGPCLQRNRYQISYNKLDRSKARFLSHGSWMQAPLPEAITTFQPKDKPILMRFEADGHIRLVHPQKGNKRSHQRGRSLTTLPSKVLDDTLREFSADPGTSLLDAAKACDCYIEKQVIITSS